MSARPAAPSGPRSERRTVTGGGSAGLSIRRFHPDRPWYQPGGSAWVRVEVEAEARTRALARLELMDVDRIVAAIERRLLLDAGRSVRSFRVPLPDARRHGYGLRLTIHSVSGETRQASSAVEALDGWWESPRHVSMTEFGSPAAIARNVAGLADWHVTVAQFYDWMYRHYRYEPPRGRSFTDALGREVSHEAVRAGVRACRTAGIASLAYGSVYGAEREYMDRHPDERVFDEGGQPVSLGDTFFINDLRPDGTWRRRLLGEYERACRRFGFDGIHMDTYGPPYEAVAADGEPIRFAELYPGLIAEAAERLGELDPPRRVLLNCVEGFPLESVATAPAAALYLELWPPDVRYADIVRWIERARRLGEGRAVVIAAYLSIVREVVADPRCREGAIEAAILLTSVIAAAGGYHQVLAEGDHVLVEGYYPKAEPLTQSEARELSAAWRFGARYLHLLSDPSLAPEPEPTGGLDLIDADGRSIPMSDQPEAGRVWVQVARTAEGARVLQLIDLRDQPDDRWDALRTPSPNVEGWRIRWPGVGGQPIATSPWTADGDASLLMPEPGDEPCWFRLPPFRRWLLVLDR